MVVKKPKEKIVHESGKRKTAIARVTLRKGRGIVRINSLIIDEYSPEIARLKILEPMILAGEKAKQVDASINVRGGGVMARAEAARVALAKCLVSYFNDESLKARFLNYDRKMLVSDTRRTEPQKPYRSAARTKRQMSKR